MLFTEIQSKHVSAPCRQEGGYFQRSTLVPFSFCQLVMLAIFSLKCFWRLKKTQQIAYCTIKTLKKPFSGADRDKCRGIGSWLKKVQWKLPHGSPIANSKAFAFEAMKAEWKILGTWHRHQSMVCPALKRWTETIICLGSETFETLFQGFKDGTIKVCKQSMALISK